MNNLYTVFLVDGIFCDDADFIRVDDLEWKEVLLMLKIVSRQNRQIDFVIRLRNTDEDGEGDKRQWEV